MEGMPGLLALDRELFLAINGAHNAWADPVMHAASSMVVWFPLYALFLFLLQRDHGWRGLGMAALAIAGMILCSDTGSVVLFKNTVMRLRPCHAADLQGMVHLVDDCGGRYGFISSHAANHFAIAAFMAGALAGVARWITPALFLWAALIGYSRIYLGQHYPGDVIAGALYGSLIGWIFFAIFERAMQRWVG